MHKNNAAATNALIGTLSENAQKYLKEVFQSKRIMIQHKGINTAVARRILKPKSKNQIILNPQ